MGPENRLFMGDIFSSEHLQFDYSSKIFSTHSKSSFDLQLKPLQVPHPQFKNSQGQSANIMDFSISNTFFDRLLIVYDDGLGMFDLEPVLPRRKSLASELMILNWPNKLIDSIMRLKKEKGSAFYSDPIRRKVKSLIQEKVDQNKFDNPKFTALFVVDNQLVANQIELLKENKQLSFGQIPKYSTLVRMLASDELKGEAKGNWRLLAPNVQVLRLSGDSLSTDRKCGFVFFEGTHRQRQRAREFDDQCHFPGIVQ